MKRKPAGPVHVKAGQFIATEGDSGSEMYVIEEGQVEILKQTPGGQPRVLRVLGPGEFFGELAILAHLPRNSSARAVTDCNLLAIDEATFDQMLRQFPDVAVRMLQALARRLHEADAARAAVKGDAGAPRRPAESGSTLPLPEAGGAVPADEKSPQAAAPPPRTTTESGKLRGARLVHASGTTLPLSAGHELTVGRFDPDTGSRPDVDLFDLDTNRSTSRRHAQILREGGKLFVLEPKATANGTFVNGKRIATGVKVGVKGGDRLRFGTVMMVLKTG